MAVEAPEPGGDLERNPGFFSRFFPWVFLIKTYDLQEPVGFLKSYQNLEESIVFMGFSYSCSCGKMGAYAATL